MSKISKCLQRRLQLWLLIVAVGFAVAVTSTLVAYAAPPVPGVAVLFDWSVIKPGSGTLSSYTYNPGTDSYQIVTFGNFAGVHTLSRATTSDPYEQGVNIEVGTDAFPSDLLRFGRSSDVPGGVTHTSASGNLLLSGVVLNPTAITIKVPEADANGLPTGNMVDKTYQPGELAFITDGGTHVVDAGVTHFDWTKKLYRWDLREIGTATSAQPDFSTGTSGAPAPNENPGGAFGALGQADWNDVFTVVMTEETMRNAYTSATGDAAPTSSNDNFGRQPAWSSDGQYLYAVDSGSTVGGVYKIDARNGDTQLIYSEPGTNIISEPAVLATSLRNLGAGFGAGDQVLFDGTPANGNDGGMSYIVDTGSSTSSVQVLFDAATFDAYAGTTGGADPRSIATDSQGNIFFFDNGSGGIHVLDTEGRFRSVLSNAQVFDVNAEFEGQRNNGGMLRLQMREDGPYTAITYRGNNSYVGLARVYEGGDINRDGTVDSGDKVSFMESYNDGIHFGAPDPYTASGNDRNTTDPAALAVMQDYINYLNADINGDVEVRQHRPTGSSPDPVYVGQVTGGGVDYLDLLTLAQFIDLDTGDFDWDGQALTDHDWDIFNEHYLQDPASFGYNAFSWFDGDVWGPDDMPDGLVDDFDLTYLQALAAEVPEPSTVLAVAVCGLMLLASRRLWRKK